MQSHERQTFAHDTKTTHTNALHTITYKTNCNVIEHVTNDANSNDVSKFGSLFFRPRNIVVSVNEIDNDI